MVYGKDLPARVSGPWYFVNFLLDPVFDDDGVCVNERNQIYEYAQALIDHVRAESLTLQEKFNEENKVGKLEFVLKLL